MEFTDVMATEVSTNSFNRWRKEKCGGNHDFMLRFNPIGKAFYECYWCKERKSVEQMKTFTKVNLKEEHHEFLLQYKDSVPYYACAECGRVVTEEQMLEACCMA